MLIAKAVQTSAGSRTSDQQNAVDWMTVVQQRQDVLAAQNAGVVTGVAVGHTRIQAKYSGLTGLCLVLVT